MAVVTSVVLTVVLATMATLCVLVYWPIPNPRMAGPDALDG